MFNNMFYNYTYTLPYKPVIWLSQTRPQFWALEMDGGGSNDATKWSETVEDLVDAGDTDKAISYLETLVSNLENKSDELGKLSTLLFDLSRLYSTKGLSLKADHAQSRAITLQQLSHHAQQ